ncbi:MAG: hypothetical protein IT377_23115 [Polyangiaceae bacterium]|nr:hypothetical protein [Polyangiaceae bacterium]
MAKRSVLTLFAVLTLSPAAGAEPTVPTLTKGAVKDGVQGSEVGAEGAEWAVPGGPVVRAEAGAVLRLHPTPQPLLLGPGAKVSGYTLIVRSGKVEVSAPRKARSAVVVVGPRKHGAIVRHGVFRIAALEGSTALANVDGETSLSIQEGPYRPLAAGHVFVATASAQGSRKLALSPSSVQGSRLLLSETARARFAGLSWEAVPGAAGYRAELIDEGTGRVVAQAEGAETTLPSSFEPQSVGRYRLRVWTRDPSGIANTHPFESALQIVAVESPPGAYRDSSGVFRLGLDQRLSLRGAEGLEMSFGKGGWINASKSLGMSRDELRTVLLRLPGAPDHVTLKMAPRSVRSVIEISPRNAVWPKDPIEIRVRLEDPSGRPVPAFVKASPRVRLNTQQLNVPFSRDGKWLRAVIAPKRGGGPWVLRVDVEDGARQSLGYDFVEIASVPSEHRAEVTPRTTVRRTTASRR